jgi:hypothetical protein
MSTLIKVSVIEHEDSDSFYLYFWGDDKRDALNLAAELCDHDKLVMLGYKIVASSIKPEPLMTLGAGLVSEVYSSQLVKALLSARVH